MTQDEFVEEFLKCINELLEYIEKNESHPDIDRALVDMLGEIKEDPTPENAKVLAEVLSTLSSFHTNNAVNNLIELNSTYNN